MIEKLEEIVETQVEAIKNLKIDKITVWDSGSGNSSGNGDSSTANFLSSMVKSLPPLQDIAGMAGVELPEYLGKVSPESLDDAADPKLYHRQWQDNTKKKRVHHPLFLCRDKVANDA